MDQVVEILCKVLQHKILSGIIFIAIGLLFMCLHGGTKKNKPKSAVWGYVAWVPVWIGVVLICCHAVESVLVPDKFVNVRYGSNEGEVAVTTVTTTLFTTLLTANLALLALVVTAYVFLIGALSDRAVYEKLLIDEMIAKRTRELIILSGYTGTLVLLCLVIDNGNLEGDWFDWMKYGIAAASFMNTVALILFIYKLISYESQLCTLAIKKIRRLEREIKKADGYNNATEKIQEKADVYKEENIIIKRIGDLEVFINQILKNHEIEYRYSRHRQEMLHAIFAMKLQRNAEPDGNMGSCSEDMCSQYFRLVELRDSYLIGRRRIIEENLSSEERLFGMTRLIWNGMRRILINENIQMDRHILDLHQVRSVQCAIDRVWDYLKQKILAEERFIGQSFSGINFGGADLSDASFRDSAISDCLYDNAVLSAADFTGVLFHHASMENVKCKNTVFSDVKFYGFQISRESDFTRAVFNNADFNSNIIGFGEGQDQFKFREVSCKKAIFIDCKVENVDFSNSVFEEALLSHANIINCKFPFADFSGAILAGTILENCGLDYANLENVTGVYSSWESCRAAGARMAGANFTESKICKSHFQGVYASDSSFSGADLADSHFEDAVMSKTDFSNTIIRGCFFRNANLTDILLARRSSGVGIGYDVLERTDFSGADFTGSQIKNVVFEECNFDNAIFNDVMVKDVTFIKCHFKNAQFLGTYIMNVRWRGNDIGTGFKKFLNKIEFATEGDIEGFKSLL